MKRVAALAHYEPAWQAAPAGSRSITVTVEPARPNPWIQQTQHLRYLPGVRQLEAADWSVMLPKALGERLAARESLAPSARSSGGGGHTALFAGIGAAGLAGVALMALVRRRRRTH